MAVRYRPGDTGASTDAFTKNIGVGGAFILTAVPLTPGARVELEISVPSDEAPLAVSAEVRWVRPEPEDERGMGVKFLHLDVEQLLVLDRYFGSLTPTVDHDEV